LSELLRWFERRRQTRTIKLIQRHLGITTAIVEDLESAIKAAVNGETKKRRDCVDRITEGEKAADKLRRMIMDELSTGELPPVDREDLMHLTKRVDLVADWSREATRILNALPMEIVPKKLQHALVEMVENVKICAFNLRECINKMIKKPEEALQAADVVERQEEKVDDLHERARKILAEQEELKVGTAILTNELLEALEMIADACENACDQVRIIIIGR
jgi:hypothetical protein